MTGAILTGAMVSSCILKHNHGLLQLTKKAYQGNIQTFEESTENVAFLFGNKFVHT